MSLDAMKQALEALEMVTVDAKTTPNSYEASRQAITALRAAIEQAQPERQPVQESALTHNHLWIGELYGREKNT